MMTTTRKEFLRDVAVLAAAAPALALPVQSDKPRVLLVVAHPDDEYTFAATVYRITRELGGTVDQIVITNGEAGFRYSRLAEVFYGLPLTREETGRSRLPQIRKEETRRAGQILGIRRQIFLDQTDAKFTLDRAEAFSGIWDLKHVRASIAHTLAEGQYDFVFVLMPTDTTHGHHQAAATLTLEAVGSMPAGQRPVVLGSEPSGPRAADRPAWRVSRSAPLPDDPSLTYNIVVNWVVAEHKSQGLLQTEPARHSYENFWILNKSTSAGEAKAERLFASLAEPRSASAVAGR